MPHRKTVKSRQRMISRFGDSQLIFFGRRIIKLPRRNIKPRSRAEIVRFRVLYRISIEIHGFRQTRRVKITTCKHLGPGESSLRGSVEGDYVERKRSHPRLMAMWNPNRKAQHSDRKWQRSFTSQAINRRMRNFPTPTSNPFARTVRHIFLRWNIF